MTTVNFDKQICFYNEVYSFLDKSWLIKLNKISDTYIKDAKNRNKNEIVKRNKLYNKDIKDRGFVHHSDSLLEDKDFFNFQKFIAKFSWNILNEQGYKMEIYDMMITELWVQEFSLNGGGYHNSHIHEDNNISGFYFLKCSEKTSYPVFYDPRIGKAMTHLKERDPSKITSMSEKINYKPKPGTFIFFNSFMPHEFVVDDGIEPFRFIHFNIKATPKNKIIKTF